MSKPMSSQVKRNGMKSMSVLDRRDMDEIEPQENHLIEVITDADLDGRKRTRKSFTCFRIFLDSCLFGAKSGARKQ